MDNNVISSQLAANAKALEWGRVYLQGQELTDFRETLISNRIRLKQLLHANSVNPAAAIFGESQVGKSYMVDCLLTGDTQVLNIYNGDGQPTGFLEAINPLGKGKEATSLISRFTTQQVWKDPAYCIKATMLTPIDVLIVLLDAYYNDVINHDFPKADVIKEEVARLKKSYQSRTKVQDIITEDEVYELKEYLMSDLMSRGEAFREALLETKYHEELALIITHIPEEQWADVFEFLWNKNEILTGVFRKLISTLKRMDFSRTVYIKMDSVLRKTGTILHVDRLYELFGISEVFDDKGNRRTVERASVPTMSVMTEKGSKLDGVEKSEFCALAMELAFTIVNPQEDNSSFLGEKPFLKNSDILDFPGARSRKRIEADIISETDACEMILRGKVAYLFNKYSQQYLITNLLFCHHDVKSEVSTLSSLLKGWVESTVGDTPEKRNEFMKIAEVSPLFVIGTKFNIDLTKDPNDSKGDAEARQQNIDYRWSKRFDILENLIAPSVKNDWLNQWTPGQPFNNIYLLRSYEYSCQGGLYIGYQEKEIAPDGETIWKLVHNPDGTLQGELRISDEYSTFIPKLKESFLKNGFVKEHFADPNKSWDEAVSVRKDGSEWVIENLSRSSARMNDSRNVQFTNICREVFDKLINSLYAFYHDDNSDLELQKQARAAGTISLMFDVLFGKDKYFFSDFISSMTVDEEELHDVVMDIINNMVVVDNTDLSVLFAIRAKAGIDNNLQFEENVARLMRAYNCETEEQLVAVLDDFKVTIEDIIHPPKMMNFSRMIADAVECMWIGTRLSVERYHSFVKRGFKEAELKKLLENTRALYCDKIKLSDRIAKKIHPFVSSSNAVDEMADMLADICAEMINCFVNTMGACYYENEMWKSVKSTIEKNKFEIEIPPYIQGGYVFDEFTTREALPTVFDTFDNVDQILNEIPVDRNKLRNFSNYVEFYNWSELMKISFLATQGIPKYDVNMNNALRSIFIEIIAQEVLSGLVQESKVLKSLQSIHSNENN